MKDAKEDVKKTEKSDSINFQSLGNICLMIIAVLIIGNALLIYYMINSKEYEDANLELPQQNMTQTEEKVDTVANILNSVVSGNTASSSITVNSTDTANKKIVNENRIVLYNGLILNTEKMDCVSLQYIDGTSLDKDKYEITYYNYEDFQEKEATLGKLSDPYFDNFLGINNVSKIAISEDYNAIPRVPKVVNTVPNIVLENNPQTADFDSIKTIAVDLEGNGTEEYITILSNKNNGTSKISLFDASGKLINDLAIVANNQPNAVTGERYYFSLENVNIIDVDNDGIMEILLEIPQHEGTSLISIVKFRNGELEGKANVECNINS